MFPPSRKDAMRLVVLVGIGRFLVGATTDMCYAQVVEAPTIRVETHEVVLPVQVIEIRKDPKGLLTWPDGTVQHVYLLHSREITGLSAKSFHVFEDGREQRIQHFSVENDHLWVAQDNVAQHSEYSCTPKGIWGGSDETIPIIESLRLHTYLLTYVPLSSPRGSCHRISLKVDHKHATIFAPDQYCNRKDPLSDPLDGGELGNRLLDYSKSPQPGTLPLAIQLSAFSNSSGTYRVNVSADIPASLLERKWEGVHLRTSIGILGLIYDKSNALAFRFSDIACVPSESDIEYNGPLPSGDAAILPISESLKGWERWTIPTTYQTQVELGPGDYRLELVITDGEKFGRATASFRLDDFVQDHLAISGIALCRRYRQAPVEPRSPSQAPQYVPLLFNGTEFTPAGDTRFHKGEHFTSFFEIYGTQLEDAAVTMRLEVRVTDTTTGEIKLDSGPQPLRFSTPPKNHSAAVVREVSIDALPSDSYHLEAQVSDSEGHKTSWSLASFTVE